MDVINHPHPGITLREDVIVPLGLTVSDAAEKLGVSRDALSRVVNGRAGISAELAIRLEAAGISSARFWIALQAEYDLEKAKRHTHPKVERLMEPVLA